MQLPAESTKVAKQNGAGPLKQLARHRQIIERNSKETAGLRLANPGKQLSIMNPGPRLAGSGFFRGLNHKEYST